MCSTLTSMMHQHVIMIGCRFLVPRLHSQLFNILINKKQESLVHEITYSTCLWYAPATILEMYTLTNTWTDTTANWLTLRACWARWSNFLALILSGLVMDSLSAVTWASLKPYWSYELHGEGQYAWSLSSTTIPKSRGLPPSTCSDTSNLWKLQRAEQPSSPGMLS